MTTFWVVTGVVVAVLLAVGWLYDRRWGFNARQLPSDAHRAGAEADGRNTQHRVGGSGTGF